MPGRPWKAKGTTKHFSNWKRRHNEITPKHTLSFLNKFSWPGVRPRPRQPALHTSNAGFFVSDKCLSTFIHLSTYPLIQHRQSMTWYSSEVSTDCNIIQKSDGDKGQKTGQKKLSTYNPLIRGKSMVFHVKIGYICNPKKAKKKTCEKSQVFDL
mgnify:CR=1 FL=1